MPSLFRRLFGSTPAEAANHSAGANTALLSETEKARAEASVELGKFTLAIPTGHWLASIVLQLPDYSHNVGRIAATLCQFHPDAALIDVGANIGDTAAILRTYTDAPILCIEGDHGYFDFLRRNVVSIGTEIELEQVLLDTRGGAEKGSFTLERGTGFFRPSEQGDEMQFETLPDVLRRHPRFHSARLLKLDTDGMDGRIIMGAIDWIAEVHPVLFWEHDIGLDRSAGGPGLGLFRSLHDAGYRRLLVYDNKGEYILGLPVDADQQIADISDYLPGGPELDGYCDVAAFTEEDLPVCSAIREKELAARKQRRGSRR